MNVKIDEIKKIAREAGTEILKHYDQQSFLYLKKNHSPLTEADLISEKIILDGLKKFKIPILSEESADSLERLNSECIWIVDPLDGTSDFLQKTGEFSIMIALIKNHKPITTVIYEPFYKTIYWAEKGRGSFQEKNGQIKQNFVSERTDFQKMKLLISRNHLSPLEIKLSENLKIKQVAPMGSAGVKMNRLASDQADIYLNSSNKTSEWDTAAGSLILKEAGGVITDLNGKQIIYNQKNTLHLNGFVCSNGKNHLKLISKIKELST